MKLRIVPAQAGAQWVRKGFGVFLRQPLAFSGMFILFFVGSLFLLSLPYLGQFLTLALLPTITVGFMLATQRALAGKPSLPTLLLAPLAPGAPGRKILWQQGLLYALCALLTMLVADLLDGGRLADWQSQVGDGGHRGEDLAMNPACRAPWRCACCWRCRCRPSSGTRVRCRIGTRFPWAKPCFSAPWPACATGRPSRSMA